MSFLPMWLNEMAPRCRWERASAVGLAAFLLCTSPSEAEQLLSYAEERRTVLTFQVPEQALQPLLPTGWDLSPSSAGIHEGANLFLVLADQRFIRDVRGRTVENTLAAVWLTPARDRDDDEAFLVLGGYTDPEAAPGTYGVYQAAGVTVDRSDGVATAQDGVASESWEAVAPDGSMLLVELTYDRGPIRRADERAHTHSAQDPSISRIYRYDQQVLVLQDAQNERNGVRQLELRVSGGQLDDLIAGTDQLVSVVSIPWTAIRAYLP